MEPGGRYWTSGPSTPALKPLSRAKTIAWARVDTPSLPKGFLLAFWARRR
jgi:hypothetical protein